MEHAVKQIIQIVPGLAPKVDGIGDYGLQLARQLKLRHAVETKFLVADPTWHPDGNAPEFPARKLTERSVNGFIQALKRMVPEENDAPQLLLHVSPYGYEKRGVPFWLAEAMEQCARTLNSNISLCFHELERTDAPPWSSGFWVPPFQRSILRRIAATGIYRFTNIELYRQRLESMGVGRLSVIPNFSTITEPLKHRPFSERRRDLIVFGRESHRRETYRHGNAVLEVVCRQLGIERIIDIGPPIRDNALVKVGDTPILKCGRLSEADVSDWMESSLGSFIWYPVQFLTKSSVHAVASAHGTLSFVYDDTRKEVSCPGLEAGVDFIPVLTKSSRLDKLPLAELSALAYSNYQRRASWTAADTLAQNLFGPLTAIHRLD
jgi:hypothetical protein